MSYDFKIVFLDEADRLTPEAQDALKSLMEEYAANARFIFTSNKPHKIIPELKSRVFEIEYKTLDKDEMMMRFATILKQEKIKVKDLDIIDEYVDQCYPDFRKLLITAQASVRDNTLPPFKQVLSDTTEYMVNVIKFIERDDWNNARTYLASNIPDDKWEECYRFLYDYLHEIGKFTDTRKWKAGIIVVSDHLYRHAFIADPEMNFTACLVRLSEI
jgi:DNA polymerase III delta prime subunit